MSKKRYLAVMAAAAIATSAWVTAGHGRVPRATTNHVARYASRTPTPVRRGRPRKFGRPARAVTLTLPHDVIEALREIDPDLSRAVVSAVQAPLSGAPRAEVATVGTSAVILVSDSAVLRQHTGVELVPISDTRALVAFDDRMTVPHLELRVLDALADASLNASDRAMFEQLAKILRSARLSGETVLEQRSIVVMRRQAAVDSDDRSEPVPSLKAV